VAIELNDWRGTPIEVGSTIVYAVASSGSMISMVEAVVEEVGEEEGWNGPVPVLWVRRKLEHWSSKFTESAKNKRVKLSRLDRIVVVPSRAH
jgi:hypothetical protein